MHQVLEVIAGYGLNIVNLSTLGYTCRPEETSHVSLFIDFTDSSVTLEKLLEELRALGNVVEVDGIRQQLPGFTVNTGDFPLQLMRYRAVILREPVYMGLISGLRERLGGAGEALLYHVGLEAGKALGSNIVEMGFADQLPIALRLIEIIHGRAVLEFGEYTPGSCRCVVRAYNLFECEGAGRKSKPYSSFYRGFLSGVFTSTMVGEVSVAETKCIAVGDDYCEFQLESQGYENPKMAGIAERV
ncbi:MAG: V4R domain-containing protein [Nitrososphaerota archaeon]